MARYRQSVHVVATAAAQPATDSWRSGSTTRTMIQPTNTIGNGNLPEKAVGLKTSFTTTRGAAGSWMHFGA